MRWVLRGLTGLISVPLLYLLATLVGALVPGVSADLSGERLHRVGLARGPIHYDLLLPLTPDLRAAFAFAEAAGTPVQHPDAQWLVVGWGAEQFYTATEDLGDMALAPVWQAVTGDRAVLRLDLAGALTDLPGLSWIFLSDAQLAALIGTVEGSFSRDAAGAPIPLGGEGFGDYDAFFRAEGQFNIFHTCNQWIGETLRAAGVPFGIWTPTPQAVSLSLWWHGD